MHRYCFLKKYNIMIGLLLVAVGVFVYLMYVLLKPEKF